jgi:predicted  nucleic acid-binding Zn-ribbon protein|tara:strand:- start:2521 stop:2838 length:318 start_codon:yes stop_codon:yes gene_type:complete
MGSGYEKTAKEHMVLSGLENYIEDTIEYSDTILSIHNDVEDVKQTAEDNHRYAMEHINDEYNKLESHIDNEVYNLKDMDNDLKDYIDVLEERIEELEKLIEEVQK